MPKVVFTSNLKRHIDVPEMHVDAATVREALDAVFASNELLRGYIVDEQHRLRKHMVIFVDGAPVKDREQLNDPVAATSEVYVMQALSGG